MVCSVTSVHVVDTMHLGILSPLNKISFFLCKYVIWRIIFISIRSIVHTIYRNPKFSVVGHFHLTKQCDQIAYRKVMKLCKRTVITFDACFSILYLVVYRFNHKAPSHE